MVKEQAKTAVQEKSSSSPRAFWQTISSLLGRHSQNDLMLIMNDQQISNDLLLTGLFADFFVGKVERLSKLDLNPLREIGLQPAHNPLVFDVSILEKVIQKIKLKKCYGTDNVPLILARDLISLNLDAMLQVMNNAARFGMPDDWRTARVLPLH
jgi:hypothetical protein